MAIKFSYRLLDGTFNYLVSDASGKEYAVFRLIDAPALKPEPGCKHMDLNFHREIIMEIGKKSDYTLMSKIFLFVFNSVLEITHDLKGYKLCKLYSNDGMILIAYQHFAKALSIKQYDVKTHGNWIEIRKK